MTTLDTDHTEQDSLAAPGDAALAGIVGLARLSRLTLLYHGAMGSDGGRQQAEALAAAADGDVVVLFDAGSELPLPDLLSAIEEAVLQARPQAPLAPPMAGPAEALLSWQQALDLRFLLIFYRFDAALTAANAEFDAELLRLARDPALDASLLLMMDEAAAPRLARLREELPDLGEGYLRLPEAGAPRGAAEAPAPVAAPAWTAPAPASLAASPFLDEPVFDQAPADIPPPWQQRKEPTLAPLAAPSPDAAAPDDDQSDLAAGEDAATAAAQRRRRPFPSLLEQAAPGLPFDADLPHQAAPAGEAPEAGVVWSAPLQRAMPVGYEPRPLPVAAWMQKRHSRRRRTTLGLAASSGMASGILFVFMMLLALICWQLPQLH